MNESRNNEPRRPDCVTEVRMGNTVLVVSGYFKKDAAATAADKMMSRSPGGRLWQDDEGAGSGGRRQYPHRFRFVISPAVKIVVLTGDKAANLAFTRYTDSRLLWYDVHTE